MEVKAAIERRLREEEALRRIEGERERLKSIREKAFEMSLTKHSNPDAHNDAPQVGQPACRLDQH